MVFLSSPPDEVDIVIVGGGAAGCVIAGRLAIADTSLEIAVLESGVNNKDDPLVTTPAHFLAHQAPGTTSFTYYKASPSPHLNYRAPTVHAANILGGGSSVNFMLYNRPSSSDFEEWNVPGWTPRDLIPLFKKLETYHISPGDDTHGYDGPLHVSYGGHTSALTNEFLAAAMDHRTWEPSIDVNDFETGNKSTFWPKWIHPETGRRSDAAHAYLHPVMDQQTNLRVFMESKVTRVLFEANVAVGVEYLTSENKTTSIRARKLVVISAGALSSPLILQRSGIGSSTRLAEIGIPVVSDLPGVGENYQDHQLVMSAISRVESGPDDTGDGIISSNPDILSRLAEEYNSGKGALAWNFADAGGKLRPTLKELREMDSFEFEKKWIEFFIDKPEKPVIFVVLLALAVGEPSQFPTGQYMTVAQSLQYPFSRGSIHITSSDIHSPPAFDAGFLSHPADLAPQVWAYKTMREITRRMPSFRGEIEATHPQFPRGSMAACISSYTPFVKDVVYSDKDNEAIEHWVRSKVETTWHSSGTCAMKDREADGVVDRMLNVYGTKKLKVVDLSICPAIVGANTYSTALVIGEKASLIIAEELGLTHV